MRASTQKTNFARVVCASTTSIRKWRPRPQAAPASARKGLVQEMFLHPASAAHLQVTEKAIWRRAQLSLWPRALGLSVEDAQANVICCHRLTKICWRKLAGHCVALFKLRHCRQPNLGAEARKSTSSNDSKQWVPSQHVVLVREQPFLQDLGLLRVVPRKSTSSNDSKQWVPSQHVVLVREQPFRQDLGLLRVVPRQFPGRLLGVLVQRSTAILVAKPLPTTACSRERLRKKVGHPCGIGLDASVGVALLHLSTRSLGFSMVGPGVMLRIFDFIDDAFDDDRREILMQVLPSPTVFCHDLCELGCPYEVLSSGTGS